MRVRDKLFLGFAVAIGTSALMATQDEFHTLRIEARDRLLDSEAEASVVRAQLQDHQLAFEKDLADYAAYLDAGRRADALIELREGGGAAAEEARQGAQDTFLTWIVFQAGLGPPTLTAVVLSRHLSRPLVLTSQRVRRMSEGDLTEEVDPRTCRRSDEVGRLGRAVESAAASETIAAAVGQVKDEAECQAMGVRETSQVGRGKVFALTAKFDAIEAQAFLEVTNVVAEQVRTGSESILEAVSEVRNQVTALGTMSGEFSALAQVFRLPGEAESDRFN